MFFKGSMVSFGYRSSLNTHLFLSQWMRAFEPGKIWNSLKKNHISQHMFFTKNASFAPPTGHLAVGWNRPVRLNMGGIPMARSGRRGRFGRHWRPALLALCLVGATWGASSFAMPKVEAEMSIAVGMGWNQLGCEGVFFVGVPPKKGKSPGFLVNWECPKMWWLVVFDVLEEIWMRSERCWKVINEYVG